MTYSKPPAKRIAIIGGGPSALFLVQALLAAEPGSLMVDIFESDERLGPGMPYCSKGASVEHVTNVSSNEVPRLPSTVTDWLKACSPEMLREYGMEFANFSERKVLPRLLFGEYLADQFDDLLARAKNAGLSIRTHLCAPVTDIAETTRGEVMITVEGHAEHIFDVVVVCSGHTWPTTHEGEVPRYYDSPYPPQKIKHVFNHPVAIRGSSLTAIDAICTLARANGEFRREEGRAVSFVPKSGSENFKIVMHSREGFLPGIRFHLEDPHFTKTHLISPEELQAHREENGGYVSLDFVFERNFKFQFREDPEFFHYIENMHLEQFVDAMLKERERTDAFTFF
ncbi:MAG: FAD/NAD(P)-binding protein [Bdellovibrionota bacterium]